MATAAGDEETRPYHDGELPRALLEAAFAAIEEVGPAALSLRDLARRAGASHAAPAHHFGDKAGLLTAVAADGFRRLAATLGEAYRATGSFLEVGVAYARFEVTHRAHFEVMFRPELYRADDPALVHARDAARSLLYPPAAEAAHGAGGDELRAAVAAWSLVPGLVALWLNDNLPPGSAGTPRAVPGGPPVPCSDPGGPGPRPGPGPGS